MAMRVPDAGNPFAVDVAIGGTRQMPSLKIPETKYGPDFVSANLEHAGTELQGAMAKWQEEIDTTRARDFTNKLQAKVNDIANNKDTGYKQLLGINALQRPDGRGLMETTQEDLKSYYEELRGSAGNERQRQALDELYGSFSTRLGMDVSNHLTAQQIAWTKSVDQDTIREASRMAVSDNAQERDDGFTTLRAMAAKQADQEGRPVDYAPYLGGIHAVNVSNLVDQLSISAARQYLKENRGEMTADQIVSAQNLIKKGAEQASIKGWTEKILNGIGAQNPEAAVLAASEAVEKVPEKIRDDVRKNVNARLGIQAQLRKAQVAQICDQIYTLRYQGEEVPLSLLDTLSQLDPQAALGFRQYEEKLQAAQANGKKDIDTDQGMYAWLTDIYATDPESFRNLDLRVAYGDKLSSEDFNHFRGLQKAANNSIHSFYLSKVKALIESDKTLKKNEVDVLRAADEVWQDATAEGRTPSYNDADMLAKALTQKVGTFTDSEGKEIKKHYSYQDIIGRRSGMRANLALSLGGADTHANLVLREVPKDRRTPKQIQYAQHYALTGEWPAELRSVAMALMRKDAAERVVRGEPAPTLDLIQTETLIDDICRSIVLGLHMTSDGKKER